jgi:hypothetical protein
MDRLNVTRRALMRRARARRGLAGTVGLDVKIRHAQILRPEAQRGNRHISDSRSPLA